MSENSDLGGRMPRFNAYYLEQEVKEEKKHGKRHLKKDTKTINIDLSSGIIKCIKCGEFERLPTKNLNDRLTRDFVDEFKNTHICKKEK